MSEDVDRRNDVAPLHQLAERPALEGVLRDFPTDVVRQQAHQDQNLQRPTESEVRHATDGERRRAVHVSWARDCCDKRVRYS